MLQISTKQLKKKSKDQTAEFDEDHALDMVMNDIVEDLEEEDLEPVVTPEQLQEIINESGIKDVVNNIQAEFKEVIDDFKDLDVTLTDGLEELDKEEESIKSKLKMPKFNFKIKKAIPQGLVDQKMEQRTVKSEQTVDDSLLKKGPLWQYRTNKSNDDKFID